MVADGVSNRSEKSPLALPDSVRYVIFFFFSSRRRHTRYWRDWSSDVCSSDLDGTLMWLMRKNQCMHCAEPGCLAACPSDGAIVQYTNGIVDFQQANCIGCGYCITGCPFDIPKMNPKTNRVFKCTLCTDRVSEGLEPACIKACPTGCLHFGSKDDMLDLAGKLAKQLRDHSNFPHAAVYNPPAVGGTGASCDLAG